MRSRVAFLVEVGQFGRPTITPTIDGARLSDLVKAFERDAGFADAGSYGGLIPVGFNYGPLDRYFLGRPEGSSYWLELGGIYLLGCDKCGDVGCWPLVCSISQSDVDVRWAKFRQPHIKKWDYSGFGPFVFDRREYAVALENLMVDLAGMEPT